jgi:sugar phosphate isomerase/epimerase
MLTPDAIALQLYTVRSETAKDFAGTLRRVAEVGYTAVEPAGYGGLSVTEARAALDASGLRAPSAHLPLAGFEHRLEETLEDAAVLGCNYVVVPFLPPERRGKEDAASIVAVLNRAGTAARQAGLVLAYHNHAFEYEPLSGDSGETLFDFLLENTDPELVAFELDVFWTKVAGVDPVTELSRLWGRVPLLHLKDYTGGTSAESAAPVGTGSLPWPEIIVAANAAGVVWGIIEQDFPKDPLADIATGLEHAKRLLSAPS